MGGGKPEYHDRLRSSGKRFVRDRLAALLDRDTFVEDGLLAANQNPDLPADAVVTGIGRIDGRRVAVMASDATVKAGSWGKYTVEKVIRIQEQAARLKLPLVYLLDSAGARIDDQINVFPGRRHIGRIFYNQVQLSGVVPQICLLFGPAPAGAAYLTALSDVLVMVSQNASAFLGSPRMAEEVIGEKVSLGEMGGAKMHCTVSGLGDYLATDEGDAVRFCRRYFSYMPLHFAESPPEVPPAHPDGPIRLSDVIPVDPKTPFDIHQVIAGLADADSFLELKGEYAGELVTGFARMRGRPVGIVANQPRVKGGILFPESADKGARFIRLSNAYRIPLIFLVDVPGFMIGSAVEKQGIIRRGAKMVFAVSEATVPKICVILRKCYGAGLYAMAGPAFDSDCTLALPEAQIAVMGPEPAVNAVHYKKIQELPPEERAAFVAEKREAYARDIDTLRLASELIVDAVVSPDELADELYARLDLYSSKEVSFPKRISPIYPM